MKCKHNSLVYKLNNLIQSQKEPQISNKDNTNKKYKNKLKIFKIRINIKILKKRKHKNHKWVMEKYGKRIN